jgi:hypothetical protein
MTPSLVRKPRYREACAALELEPAFYYSTVLLLLPQTCAYQRKYYDGELILVTPEYLH